MPTERGRVRVLHDAAEVGIRGVVVLASGYGEVGEAGRERERGWPTSPIDRDLTVLGPNCLGYVNAHAGAGPFGLHLSQPLLAGPVGIVLQSGALASAVMAFYPGPRDRGSACSPRWATRRSSRRRRHRAT